MLRTLLAVVCLASVVDAKTPRALADVVIETPDRKGINVKKYRGKVVFAVLFLPDCPDCIEMINFASKLEAEFGSRGFQVLGAMVNDKAGYEVTPFIQRYRPNFPIGFLKKDALIKFMDLAPGGRPVAPIVMFIDHLGFVRFQYTGKDTAFIGNKQTLRTIADGLIHQRDENQAPQRVTK